ncbi:MAG TPA: ATP-dependent Clp protease adapter ClpS [Actinomycetales bacterium]|nr:ATP-dependent Clp protease adapter ClpS [Actinomycetales bacterium]
MLSLGMITAAVAAPVSAATAPVKERQSHAETSVEPEHPWVTIVWNDPVNLMSYVTYVFQTYFNYPKAKAEKLMRQVHNEGKAVVSSGTREEMERDTEAMHGYGLWATFMQDKSG